MNVISIKFLVYRYVLIYALPGICIVVSQKVTYPAICPYIYGIRYGGWGGPAFQRSPCRSLSFYFSLLYKLPADSIPWDLTLRSALLPPNQGLPEVIGIESKNVADPAEGADIPRLIIPEPFAGRLDLCPLINFAMLDLILQHPPAPQIVQHRGLEHGGP